MLRVLCNFYSPDNLRVLCNFYSPDNLRVLCNFYSPDNLRVLCNFYSPDNLRVMCNFYSPDNLRVLCNFYSPDNLWTWNLKEDGGKNNWYFTEIYVVIAYSTQTIHMSHLCIHKLLLCMHVVNQTHNAHTHKVSFDFVIISLSKTKAHCPTFCSVFDKHLWSILYCLHVACVILFDCMPESIQQCQFGWVKKKRNSLKYKCYNSLFHLYSIFFLLVIFHI